MTFQQIVLPIVYNIYAVKPVKRGTVLLADAHHDEIPFSMTAMKRALDKQENLQVSEMYWNNENCSAMQMLRNMFRFMKVYATTQTVILCDNFLPAASCRKRRGTKVIQLWHAGGALKKFGYDTEADIPSYYKGNVMANCNLVTVSAKRCIEPFAGAMRLPRQRIRAAGISRTDLYFDENFNRECRERFFEKYPEAKGKKIVLWAPTFRGNPGVAGVRGLREIQRASERLKETHYFIIKLHPHTQVHLPESNCDIPSEELLPVTDVLITDYSSILFDAMVYRLPIILFVPDLQEYMDKRGFYLDYREVPGVRARNFSELMEIFTDASILDASVDEAYEAFYRQYMAACDGHATQRILRYIMKNMR